MADERSGNRRARSSLLRMMGLVALIAVLFKCPPVALAALPVGVYLGSKAIGNRSLIGAIALSLLALSLCGVICVQWRRSCDRMDQLAWSFYEARGLFWWSRGHLFGELRPGGGPIGPGTLELQHSTYDLMRPDFGGPDQLDMILVPPEDGDVNSHDRWGSFARYRRWNPIYRDSINRCCAPFWYLAVITLAPPLAWASRLWRSGARARGAASRPSSSEAA